MAFERRIYTARDLSRNPARVFEEARSYGDAEIRTRDGEKFVLSFKNEEESAADLKSIRADFEKLRKMRKKAGEVRYSDSDLERIDKIVAGEI